MRKRRTVVAAAIATAWLVSQNARMLGDQVDAPATLRIDSPIEHEISGSERHRYRLSLHAGECAHLRVEQRGLDVAVEILAADGSAIADFQNDMRPIGVEDIEVVASTDGDYSLVVRGVGPMSLRARYLIDVLAVRTATDADRAAQRWRHLRTIATHTLGAGGDESARPLLEEALALAEQARGKDDVEVGAILHLLGTVYLDSRDFRRSEPLYERALAIFEQAYGPDHPFAANTSQRLAHLYQRIGQLARAERTASHAVEALEKTLGPGHPLLAAALIPAGIVRFEAGDFATAEQYDRRAIDILENAGATETIQYASVLNNLGLIYLRRPDYPAAGRLFERALDIGDRVWGTDSYWSADTLQNLGIVARQQKDYVKAEAYQLRVLAIRRRIVGPEHSDVASTLNNLALIYRDKGDDERALAMLTEALHIFERAQGPYSGGTMLAAGNIARFFAARGDVPQAIAFQRRVDSIIEMEIGLNLAIGSERQKLALINAIADRTDRTISLHLNLAPEDGDAAALASLVVLQRKGRVLDAMTDTFESIRQHIHAPADRELLDQLRATTADLARAALNPPAEGSAEASRQSIAALELKKEKLEAEMSRRNEEFRVRTRPVTVDAVRAAIPPDAALIEFKLFRPFDPKNSRNSEAYGPPHYAVYVLRRNEPPRGRDLGAASPIDRAVDALRQALRDPARDDVKTLARAVDRQLLEPIRPLIGDAARLLLSADGELNLLPFEALVDEQSRYVLSRYTVSYLTSGRDLLRMQAPPRPRSGPVAVADPAFGESTGVDGDAALAATRPLRRSVTAGATLAMMYFAPLDATADEARAIKSLFPDTRVLSGRQASKAAVTSIAAPRLLHIATHGFFLQSDNGPVANPLLRSGLALSGANVRDTNAAGGGILTALEAANLNLWGTRLVTLSACDTGVGEVKTGEGVYGLRRAFFLAGAASLVMSLWPVNDAVTREIMTAYYGGLKTGLGRGDALRQARLGMLARPNRRHPFYWASFIQAGDWTALDAAR